MTKTAQLLRVLLDLTAALVQRENYQSPKPSVFRSAENGGNMLVPTALLLNHHHRA